MNTFFAQHPLLWLLLAFLLGIFFQWLLEIFFLRRPLSDAREAARRRGEELDSERFAHGRTQTELKAKMAELEQTAKGRAMAEAMVSAARSKLAITETQLKDSSEAYQLLTVEVGSLQDRLRSVTTERDQLNNQALGQRLELEDRRAALATEQNALTQVRSHAADLQIALDTSNANAVVLQKEHKDLAIRCQTLEAEVSSLQDRLRSVTSERDQLSCDLQQQRLELEERQKALTAEQNALSQLRSHAADLQAALDTTNAKAVVLEKTGQDLATQCQVMEDQMSGLQSRRDALQSELQEMTQLHSDQKSQLTELKSTLSTTQDELESAIKARNKLENEYNQLTVRFEKLEASLADSKTGSSAVEHKLKARIEEVKMLTSQMGEAAEELAAYKAKAAQLEANLEAAQATRKALEKELEETLAIATAPSPSASSAEELATLRDQLQQQERDISSWRSKAEELEAELLATSRAHQELGKEFERLKSAESGISVEGSLAADLEIMTRERNELAAELAVLKSTLSA